MIIGFGSAPRKVLEQLRSKPLPPNVLVYPEFFDSKSDLINRRYEAYVRKVREWRANIIVAVWPDYVYSDYLCKYDDIMWIFPLHSLSELSRLPPCITFVGYASAPNLRDYTIREFMAKAPRPWWYLGANSTEIYEALRYRFDGVDVTTLSIPGWCYRDNIRNGHLVVEWLTQLAKGRILKAKQLTKPTIPLAEVMAP